MSDMCTTYPHPAEESFCSAQLMYYVNEYHSEDCPPESDLQFQLDRFHAQCIFRPLMQLVSRIDSPHFAWHIQCMVSWYNWYITNRFWAFQLLYPLVSFLRVYYSIVLTNPSDQTCEDILRSYASSLSGESI